AASVALVSTQPVWVAIFGLVALGERPQPSQWIGVGLAVLGAGVIGWGDLGGGPQPLLGDVLALAGAILVGGYYVLGRKLRRGLGVWPYVAVVYAAAAVALLAVLLMAGIPVVVGHDRSDWLVF